MNVPAALAAWIEDEARRRGVTPAEVLTEAIGFYQACLHVQREAGGGPVTITPG